MSDDRARVLARVRAALARSPSRAPMPEYPDELVSPREDAGAPLESVFADRLAQAGGRSFTDPAELGRWLAREGHLRGYCDPALWSELAPAFPARIAVETRFAKGRADEYAFGVTRAAAAIAETGTVVLEDRSTPRRLAALAPWVHVAVVRRAAIHARLVDALRALGTSAPGASGEPRGADPYVVWCTGPSKTADVEGILIHGVHGPGEQVALVLS